MPKAVAREWTGAVSRYCADEYQYYLEARLRDHRDRDGNKGVYLLRRDLAQSTEFQLLSIWNDVAAIRAFTGDEVMVANYSRLDEQFLTRKPKLVSHFSVVLSDVERRNHRG